MLSFSNRMRHKGVREKVNRTAYQCTIQAEGAWSKSVESVVDGPDNDETRSLVIDAFDPSGNHHGNQTMLINDPRGLPDFETALNCEFIEVTWRGWPYIFVATTRDVAAGEELLIEYGEEYWENMEYIGRWLRDVDV